MPRKATGRSNGRPKLTSETALTICQRAALEIDLKHPRLEGEDGKEEYRPSGIPAAIVASKVGVSRQAVHKWRTSHLAYGNAFSRGLVERWSSILEATWDSPSDARDEEPIDTDTSKKLRDRRREFADRLTNNPDEFDFRIEQYVWAHWTGKVTLTDSTQVFDTEQAWIDYLKEEKENIIPMGLIEAIVDDGT